VGEVDFIYLIFILFKFCGEVYSNRDEMSLC